MLATISLTDAATSFIIGFIFGVFLYLVFRTIKNG